MPTFVPTYVYSTECIYHRLFIHSSIKGHLVNLAIVTSVASSNILVYELLWVIFFNSFEYIAESYGSSIFNFLMNCQNVFCSGWTILHSHQCMRVPIFPYPCLNWLARLLSGLTEMGVLKGKALSSHPYSSLSSRFLSTCVNQGYPWPCSIHTSMALSHTGIKVNAWLWAGPGKSWRRWWQDRRLPGDEISLSISAQLPLHFPVQAPFLLLPALYSDRTFFCKKL